MNQLLHLKRSKNQWQQMHLQQPQTGIQTYPQSKQDQIRELSIQALQQKGGKMETQEQRKRKRDRLKQQIKNRILKKKLLQQNLSNHQNNQGSEKRQAKQNIVINEELQLQESRYVFQGQNKMKEGFQKVKRTDNNCESVDEERSSDGCEGGSDKQNDYVEVELEDENMKMGVEGEENLDIVYEFDYEMQPQSVIRKTISPKNMTQSYNHGQFNQTQSSSEQIQNPIEKEQENICQKKQQKTAAQDKKFTSSQPNPQRLPRRYYIHNLLQITPYLKSLQLQSYISLMSKTHDIPYNKILVYFSVQYIIYKFYQTQHINCELNNSYIISQLERLIRIFLSDVRIIKFWEVFKKIVKIVARRFGVEKMVKDQYLIQTVKKSKKIIKQSGVDIDRLLAQSQIKDKSLLSDMNQEPKAEQLLKIKMSSLKQYMKLHYPRVIDKIELLEPDQVLLECSEKQGTSNILPYYVRLKEQAAKQQQKQAESKRRKEQSKGVQRSKYAVGDGNRFEKIDFQIVAVKIKCPKDAKILSSMVQLDESYKRKQIVQQIQQDNQSFDESFVRVDQYQIDSKAAKKKQKQREKQRERENQRERREREKEREKQREEQAQKTENDIKKMDCKSEQKMLKKLQNVLYEFYIRQPNFTMKTLKTIGQNILREQFRMGKEKQRRVIQIWMDKFARNAAQVCEKVE